MKQLIKKTKTKLDTVEAFKGICNCDSKVCSCVCAQTVMTVSIKSNGHDNPKYYKMGGTSYA